jgi:low temperature requirement protein LtrA
VVAFLETVALWWLYFGTPTDRWHAVVAACDDPGRVARDAYTYLHLPIVAGIIATAAGVELLIAGPNDSQHGVALAIVLGGPALFLLGESLFQWRTTGRANATRLVPAGVILGLAPLATQTRRWRWPLSVTSLLIALAIWEARVPAPRGRPDRTSVHPSVSRGLS